jgi:hypothetical protein
MKAAHVCEEGFARFLKELRALGVLSQDELLGWLRLHGATIRACEPLLHIEGFLEAGGRVLGFFDELAEAAERLIEERDL